MSAPRWVVIETTKRVGRYFHVHDTQARSLPNNFDGLDTINRELADTVCALLNGETVRRQDEAARAELKGQ